MQWLVRPFGAILLLVGGTGLSVGSVQCLQVVLGMLAPVTGVFKSGDMALVGHEVLWSCL